MKRTVTAQHASPPTEDNELQECLEAIWSMGGACKTCGIEACYRQGWEKDKVTLDNAYRVRHKKRMPEE